MRWDELEGASNLLQLLLPLLAIEASTSSYCSKDVTKLQVARSIQQLVLRQAMSKQEDSPDVISLATKPVVGRSLPLFAELAFVWPLSTKW